MKNERQQKILEIIASADVETQNDLIQRLSRRGIAATQATVSRDIRELKLVKEPSERGGFRYALPQAKPIDVQARLRSILKECVTGVARAQNIVVIKTLPGLAPAACSAIDKMSLPDLVGTIAGDDTAFLAMYDDDAAEELCRRMKRIL